MDVDVRTLRDEGELALAWELDRIAFNNRPDQREGWMTHVRPDEVHGVYVGPEPQWCGLTQADAWREAGIDPQWLATFWASTLRMAKWFRYEDWNGKSAGVRPAIGARMIVPGGAGGFPDGSPFRRGDVVIVGDGNPAEGDHITGLLERTGDDFATLSGNGGGVGPTGKPREGISKQTYHVNRGGYRVLWVARPGVDDLLAPR